jgi:rhodanese-related sulfurtransferase
MNWNLNMTNKHDRIDEKLEQGVEKIKDTVTEILPKPPGLKGKSSANALKERLDWGEPALTIVDVRDREAFNKERITGAVAMPLDTLVEVARGSLEPTRDIYVYGETEEQTAQAVSALREAGFEYVAHLEGGIAGWKAISGPIEGRLFNAAYSDQ